MQLLLKTFWVTQIWLLAFTTLFASIPHWQCLCPNGHLKPVCMGIVSQSASCCCNGTCCQARDVPSAKPANHPCCHARQDQTTNTPDGRCRLESHGCKRTLIPSETLVVEPQKKTADDLLVDALSIFPPSPALSTLSLNLERHPFSSYNYHSPPRTDLVIVLQHFVI